MVWHVSELWIGLVGLAAFLGHLYPVFLGFRGGKGVATALGIYLAICPLAVVIGFFLFVGTLAAWRIVSLGSMSTALVMPFLAWMLTGSKPYLIMGLCVGILIVYRHKDNIQRLIAGRENRIDLRLRKGS
jgi:glycerol-3-phosphate acyltransferase PlsY